MMPGIMPSERVQRRIDDLLDQAEEAVEAGEWASVSDAQTTPVRHSSSPAKDPEHLIADISVADRIVWRL